MSSATTRMPAPRRWGAARGRTLTHFRSCHRCRVAIWQVTGMALWLGTCIVAGVIVLCGDPRSLWFHAAGIYYAGSAGVVLGLAKRWGKRQEEEEQPDALER